MKVKILLFLLALILLSGAVISCGDGAAVITQTSGDGTVIKFKESKTNPPMLADTSKKYTATIEIEGKGNIVLELFAKDVPIAVSNFVSLATKGFYDGTTFHRVLPNFMAQGGDPTGTGTGGPGYSFGLEITNHKHTAGAISMANTGRPNSNGSQFFICFQAQPFLDGKYSVFGQVIEGMDVLKKITLRDPEKSPAFTGDKIVKVTIKVE
jgi:cyclophilin family peptidyl-prolyl cis-trans isomerase